MIATCATKGISPLPKGAYPLCLAILIATSTAAAEPALRFDQHAGRLEISVAGKPLATYVWDDPRISRPYFAHLRTLDGTQVTRHHPPVQGRDPTDHDSMHPGLWLAFGDISGGDFWRNKARVNHAGFVEPPKADARGGQFAVKNVYVNGDKTICDELCRIRIDLRPGGYVLTWDSRFSGPDAFAFGDQEEMGLGFRVATPLAMKNGGQLVNSDALENEKQVWGKQADWCDYSGTIDGRRMGLLLMPDPANFRRSWFHARDYGLLVANPFGANAFTKGAKSSVAVHPGDSLRLRYGVFVHAGDVDLNAAYKDWQLSIEDSQ
jgi:hypothetical protein